MWIRLEALPGIGNKNIKYMERLLNQEKLPPFAEKIIAIESHYQRAEQQCFESIQVYGVDYGIMHKSCSKANKRERIHGNNKTIIKRNTLRIEGKNRKQRRKNPLRLCVCVCSGKIERKRKSEKISSSHFFRNNGLTSWYTLSSSSFVV